MFKDCLFAALYFVVGLVMCLPWVRAEPQWLRVFFALSCGVQCGCLIERICVRARIVQGKSALGRHE